MNTSKCVDLISSIFCILTFCLIGYISYQIYLHTENKEVCECKPPFCLDDYETDSNVVYIIRAGTSTNGERVMRKYTKKHPTLPPVECIDEFGEIKPCF